MVVSTCSFQTIYLGISSLFIYWRVNCLCCWPTSRRVMAVRYSLIFDLVLLFYYLFALDLLWVFSPEIIVSIRFFIHCYCIIIILLFDHWIWLFDCWNLSLKFVMFKLFIHFIYGSLLSYLLVYLMAFAYLFIVVLYYWYETRTSHDVMTITQFITWLEKKQKQKKGERRNGPAVTYFSSVLSVWYLVDVRIEHWRVQSNVAPFVNVHYHLFQNFLQECSSLEI